MHIIDLATWPRADHFRKFSAFDHPHFGMTANIDVTLFNPYVRQNGHSYTIAFTYVLSRAANTVPEFCVRIRAGQVVEHDIVHPSITILATQDLFSFCTLEYAHDFSTFAEQAREKISQVKAHPTLQDPPGQDNLLYMTALPWISFTSFMHPMNLNPADSVPRFAWGKYFDDNQRIKIPLGVQGHHALMDGIHMARFYQVVQANFDQPEIVLGCGGALVPQIIAEE